MPVSEFVTPGTPAAIDMRSLRGTEDRRNRCSTPCSIWPITISGLEVASVEVHHFPNTVPWLSARARRKLLPPISTPTTNPGVRWTGSLTDFVICVEQHPILNSDSAAAESSPSPKSQPDACTLTHGNFHRCPKPRVCGTNILC